MGAHAYTIDRKMKTMKKLILKQAGITACVFLLGWASAVGYLSWKLDFNLSPWQRDDAKVLPLTQSIFKTQCAGENDTLKRAITPGNNSSEAYGAAWFSCLSDRSDALMKKLTLAVISYSYISCEQKAEGEGRDSAECKKTMYEQLLKHREHKELAAE